ncbi:MAG: oxygen-dependent coproporphyrinogen oxidase [Owenweeksia sp.]
MHSVKEHFTDFIHSLQDEICGELESLDGGAKFIEDHWERPGGGGGRSRIISHGNIFEKGGVSTSVVHGPMPDTLKKSMNVMGHSFFACGISLVLHPENPFVPTVHANYRYFEMYNGDGERIDAWFGGGSDLTPYYLFKDDAVHFHKTQKKAADKHGKELYPRFKKQCDDYFRNHHREEGRGIGGTFFDYLKVDEKRDLEDWMRFDMDMARAFLPSYLPIVNKRRKKEWNEENRYWQELRRGRYVEFNLVHDRGTLFGLKTNGRTESILMSLPPRVRWDYNAEPEAGTEEAKLIAVLKKPKDWV